MTRKLLPALLLCLALLTPGCAYVNIQTPYDRNLENTDLGSKRGTATTHSLLWLFAWGDGSYAAAARNGDIKVLKHADQEIKTFLFGLYGQRTVIVYGD